MDNITRFTRLKNKFILVILAIYIITGSVAFALSLFATERIIENLGISFAIKQALWDKNRILAPIQQEVVLAKKLADSPLLKRWARHENDPFIKELALAELNSFRKSFQDGSYFFVIDASKHYYFNDATDQYRGQQLRYTLEAHKPEDNWYFSTLAKVDDFDLNVDYDKPLDVTKVWINTIIKEGREKLGIAGTGLDLGRFIHAVTDSGEKGVSTILLDRVGAIQAHPNLAYIDYNTLAKNESERSTLYRLLPSPKEHNQLRESLKKLADGRSEVETFYLTLEGHRYLSALTYLEPIEWYNLVLVNLPQVLSTWEFAPLVGVLALSLLAVIVIVTLLLNRIVLTPLMRLTRSAQAIAAGDYNTLLPVDRDDEIGQLTRAFNHMNQTVRDYTHNLELKVKERTEELNRSNRQLAKSNRQIMDSIHYARLIQSSILPKDELLKKYLSDHFIIWKPRDLVSGDFYYFHEGEKGFLIGMIDCTGHGVPGAFMTMTANAILSRVIETIGIAEVAVLLQTVNRIVRTTLNQDEKSRDVDNGMDMGLCYCEPGQGRLIFAGARISLFYGDGDEVIEIKGDRQSLGYQRSNPDFNFTQHVVDPILERSFYLTTDGFLDQAGGAKRYGFGDQRFRTLLSNHQALPMEAQKAVFERALSAYQGNLPQRDDIAFIGFKVKISNHFQN